MNQNFLGIQYMEANGTKELKLRKLFFCSLHA